MKHVWRWMISWFVRVDMQVLPGKRALYIEQALNRSHLNIFNQHCAYFGYHSVLLLNIYHLRLNVYSPLNLFHTTPIRFYERSVQNHLSSVSNILERILLHFIPYDLLVTYGILTSALHCFATSIDIDLYWGRVFAAIV